MGAREELTAADAVMALALLVVALIITVVAVAFHHETFVEPQQTPTTLEPISEAQP